MPQRTIEKMGADEVAAIAEQVKDQEEILDNVDNLGSDYLQDKDGLRKQITRSKKILEKDAELVPQTAGQKDAIFKEIKRLEELVIKEMPTVNEMNAQLGSREADQAVRKNLNFQKKWNSVLLRLKDLKRRLDPEDPFAGDLERIRPK